MASNRSLSACLSSADPVLLSPVSSTMGSLGFQVIESLYPIAQTASSTRVCHVSQFDLLAFRMVTLSKALNTFDIVSLSLSESESKSGSDPLSDGSGSGGWSCLECSNFGGTGGRTGELGWDGSESSGDGWGGADDCWGGCGEWEDWDGALCMGCWLVDAIGFGCLGVVHLMCPIISSTCPPLSIFFPNPGIGPVNLRSYLFGQGCVWHLLHLFGFGSRAQSLMLSISKIWYKSAQGWSGSVAWTGDGFLIGVLWPDAIWVLLQVGLVLCDINLNMHQIWDNSG